MGLFRKKRKQPALTRDQALACTPVRNDIVSWEVLESGLVRIEYVLVLKPFLKSISERFSSSNDDLPTRKLELDALGSQVWQMIDGSRTTAQLVEEFARLQKISNQEAEQSITLFLRELGKRGLIALG
ncbi:MAG: PqqD family protein [Desulfofustis sp.]|nr:PqqD family protein [Desulfofustis sp.]NNK56043.1 PqqD family protein [Desulfofustis sp.]RZW27384.1 MAG: PqqD family protein [Desulfobulbaceae bacterium]